MKKIELEEEIRKIDTKYIISDLQRVAKELHKKNLTIEEYERLGKYPYYAPKIKFGRWQKAMKAAKLKGRVSSVNSEQLIGDLQRTIILLNQRTLGMEEYMKFGMYGETTISQRFGSWNKALKQAGIDIQIGKLSEEELLKNMIEVSEKLGKIPKMKDVKKPISECSAVVYQKRFGSWKKALLKAGLDINKSKASEEELLKNLQEVKVKLGRVPKMKDTNSTISKYHANLYVREFGSWNKALDIANFRNNRKRNITDKELLDDLKETGEKLKRTPKYKDILNHCSKFSTTTFVNRFGTWNKALKRAGFQINQEY